MTVNRTLETQTETRVYTDSGRTQKHGKVREEGKGMIKALSRWEKGEMEGGRIIHPGPNNS